MAAGGRHAGRKQGGRHPPPHTRSCCGQPVGSAVRGGAPQCSRYYPRMEPWCRTPAPSLHRIVLLLLLLLKPVGEPTPNAPSPAGPCCPPLIHL